MSLTARDIWHMDMDARKQESDERSALLKEHNAKWRLVRAEIQRACGDNGLHDFRIDFESFGNKSYCRRCGASEAFCREPEAS